MPEVINSVSNDSTQYLASKKFKEWEKTFLFKPY